MSEFFFSLGIYFISFHSNWLRVSPYRMVIMSFLFTPKHWTFTIKIKNKNKKRLKARIATRARAQKKKKGKEEGKGTYFEWSGETPWKKTLVIVGSTLESIHLAHVFNASLNATKRFKSLYVLPPTWIKSHLHHIPKIIYLIRNRMENPSTST